MTLRIDPETYYEECTLRVHGLDERALARAREEGLRHKRLGRKVLYKGAWLIEWLDGEAPGKAQGREVKAS
jgi:hypothetical protein